MINFDRTGKTVKEINQELLARRIFGGKDLSQDFPQYGQSALYCISELTTEEEIENLRTALTAITEENARNLNPSLAAVTEEEARDFRSASIAITEGRQ